MATKTTTSGTLTKGNMIATPTASTTSAQRAAAESAGWKPSVVTSTKARETTNTNLKDLGTMSKNTGLTVSPSGADEYATRLLEDAANAPKSAYQLQYERQSKGLLKQIDSLSSSLDSNSRALMESIKGEYADLQAQQENTNKAYQGGINVEGQVSGRERYAPNLQGGVVANAINYGIRQISDIQNKKNKALAEAENARIQGQFQLMSKKMDVARQLAMDEKSTIQTTLENTRKAKEEYNKTQEDYATTLAPSIVGSLTGNATKDYKFISDTALGTGGQVSPERLYAAVTKYQNEQRKALADTYTPDIKEYNIVRSQGYKGDFLTFLKEKKFAETTPTKSSTVFAALKESGIPLDSPIYGIIGSLPATAQDFYSKIFEDAYSKGDMATVNRTIANIVFTKSSQSEKDKFTLAASGVPRIDSILAKLEKFKAEHKELDSIKNVKEYMKRAATITNDQDFIDLASQVGLTQVEIRNKFFGSALTGTEQAIAKDFLVQFDKVAGDTTDNMITKVKSLRSTLLQNREAIISAYTGMAPTQGPSTSSGVKLKDPKTGQIRLFESLSPQDLQDALSQGFIKL